MVNFFEAWATSKGQLCGCSTVNSDLQTYADAENLLVMLYTWQSGDCSNQEPYNGDFSAAMQAIEASMLVMPGKTDLFFS